LVDFVTLFNKNHAENLKPIKNVHTCIYKDIIIKVLTHIPLVNDYQLVVFESKK